MRVRSSNRESLKVSLPSEKEILLERVFHAPRRLVFEGLTRPEHVSRWWAPQALGAGMASCDAEVRVGGSYRYVVQHRRGRRASSRASSTRRSKCSTAPSPPEWSGACT